MTCVAGVTAFMHKMRAALDSSGNLLALRDTLAYQGRPPGSAGVAVEV